VNLPAPDPFAPFEWWSTPGFSRDSWEDRPLYVFAYEDLLEHCRLALSTRQKTYPVLVERRAITDREATADIRAWELLAGEWAWICGEEATLPPTGSLTERRGAVELALERIGQRFDRGDRQHDLYRQAHLNLALRWHLGRLKDGAPAVHHFAALSRELRAEAAERAAHAPTSPSPERSFA